MRRPQKFEEKKILVDLTFDNKQFCGLFTMSSVYEYMSLIFRENETMYEIHTLLHNGFAPNVILSS